MTNFDDEMRRMFADRRIGQVPNPPHVEDLVRGASRRRTRRIVVSAVSSAAVVAAVAVGATALVDFTNTASPDIAPAVTPSDEIDPTTTVEPTDNPTDDPTDPATDPTDPATDPTDPDDGNDDVPILEPITGLNGVFIGMSIAELEALDGAVVNQLDLDSGGGDFCYGTFEVGEATGFISVRNGGTEPAASEDDFVVSLVSAAGPVQTPEGITIGSTLAEVQAAYPDLDVGPNGATAGVPEGGGLTWDFTGLYDNGAASDDTVTGISLDGGQACAG